MLLLVEDQQRAEAGFLQRRAVRAEAIAVQAAEIDALLEIDRPWCRAPGSAAPNCSAG